MYGTPDCHNKTLNGRYVIVQGGVPTAWSGVPSTCIMVLKTKTKNYQV